MGIHGYTLIRRPPTVVFDFVADERNNYDPSIHAAELLTGEPIGAGTRFRCITTGRRPIEMTVEIVEYDRPHRLGTVTRLASMDIGSTLEFAPEGDTTWLHWAPHCGHAGCCGRSPRCSRCSGAGGHARSGRASSTPSKGNRPAPRCRARR